MGESITEVDYIWLAVGMTWCAVWALGMFMGYREARKEQDQLISDIARILELAPPQDPRSLTVEDDRNDQGWREITREEMLEFLALDSPWQSVLGSRKTSTFRGLTGGHDEKQ